MKSPAKEILKEYVKSQNFTNTADIIHAMKELFSDAPQQVMECKLDELLGYKKSFCLQMILNNYFIKHSHNAD